MGVDLVKRGGVFTSEGFRTVMLRNQGRTVYDLYSVHYHYASVDALAGNDSIAAALSLRDEDQVEDATRVVLGTIVVDDAIFGVTSYSVDLSTNGAIALVGVSDQRWDPPFTVPFLAWIVEANSTATVHVGVEVYYRRRVVSSAEKAAVVAQTGGRARTS